MFWTLKIGLVLTHILFLNHYYRRQGACCFQGEAYRSDLKTLGHLISCLQNILVFSAGLSTRSSRIALPCSTRKSPSNYFKLSGRARPRQGTEICNFGAPSSLEALHWIFCFFSSISVQFRRTSPLKSGESSEKSSGENRVKSCHVCGCHGFFGPETSLSFATAKIQECPRLLGTLRRCGASQKFLEDPNLPKLRSLDSSCLFFLSDNSFWGQWTQMPEMLASQG